LLGFADLRCAFVVPGIAAALAHGDEHTGMTAEV
jgi:hypothetical protein